jgi:type III secretory pathway lipoprotein EscJ
MTYEKFQTLTADKQAQTPDSQLSQIPQVFLKNGLVMSQAERKDGILGWTIMKSGQNSK